jgi:AcrR family transcriptional regulator
MVRKKPLLSERLRKSQSDRNSLIKQKIFVAAAKVVGKRGYAEASIARITEKAGVAQGTFYNYFANRQELLDQLLPTIGSEMLHYVREHTREAYAAGQEIDRFQAFFEFIREVPEFMRILNEAEWFAPVGFQKHLENVSAAYIRILQRARHAGEIDGFSDDELEAIVHMFMGARGYLSRRYSFSKNKVVDLPDHVTTAYEKLILRGLFRGSS